MTNKKKIQIILLIMVGMPLLIFVSLVFYNKKRLQNGDLIKYQGNFYTKEEFREIVPVQNYHVEAKNTPEEVYEGFRKAILENDVNGALEFIVEKNRAKYKMDFDDKQIIMKYRDLPEIKDIKLDIENDYENMKQYDYYKNDKLYGIQFIKLPTGYWKIENI